MNQLHFGPLTNALFVVSLSYSVSIITWTVVSPWIVDTILLAVDYFAFIDVWMKHEHVAQVKHWTVKIYLDIEKVAIDKFILEPATLSAAQGVSPRGEGYWIRAAIYTRDRES